MVPVTSISTGHLPFLPRQTYNIVVLQNTSSVEVMHETGVLVVSVHLLNLLYEGTTLLPSISNLTKSVPKSDEDDLSSWVLLMHLTDKIDIAAKILLVRDVVVRVVIVGAEVDDHNIGLLMMSKVPKWWVVAIDDF